MTDPIDNDADWITPADALKLFNPRDEPLIKQLIADRLRDGKIRAKAQEIWESSESNILTAWRKRKQAILKEEADYETNVSIDRLIWRSSRYWSFDLENWRWDEGRVFVTQRRYGNPARTIIVGLKFHRQDIKELMLPPSKRGGQRVKYKEWADVVCLFLELDRAGRLSPEISGKKSEFQKLVADSADKVLSPDKRIESENIERVAAFVWDKLSNKQ